MPQLVTRSDLQKLLDAYPADMLVMIDGSSFSLVLSALANSFPQVQYINLQKQQ